MVEKYPYDFWKRSHFEPGHITTSAWVVNPERTHTLLTHHKIFNMWLQLGGHVEPEDTTLHESSLREVLEESGLEGAIVMPDIFDIDMHLIDENARRQEPEHKHYDVRFLVEVPFVTPVMQEAESHAVQWFPLSEVGELNKGNSIIRMANKTPGML